MSLCGLSLVDSDRKPKDEPCNCWVAHLCPHRQHRIGPWVLLPVSLETSLTYLFSADEGGATHMRGGIPIITLPAGYLGSSFIGACLIACGFNVNASKVACLVLAVFFLFTLFFTFVICDRKVPTHVFPSCGSALSVLDACLLFPPYDY